MPDNKEISRSVFDAFNSRNFEKIVSSSADQLEWLDLPAGRKFQGRDGLKTWCEAWLAAFSEGKVEVVNHFAAGEFVCTEYIGRGKHTGMLQVGQLKLAPTQRPVEFRLCNVVQIRDGKIISGRVYYDLLTLMRQLGVEQAKLAA